MGPGRAAVARPGTASAVARTARLSGLAREAGHHRMSQRIGRRRETDCVAGVVGLELRNACASQVRAMYLRCSDNSRRLGYKLPSETILRLSWALEIGSSPKGMTSVKLGVVAGCQSANTRCPIAELAAGRVSSAPVPPVAYKARRLGSR